MMMVYISLYYVPFGKFSNILFHSKEFLPMLCAPCSYNSLYNQVFKKEALNEEFKNKERT
jgi:predicted nucleic-acid-binding Zn-ribbon protein